MKASPSPFDTLRHLEPRERRVVAVGAVVSAMLLATVWVVLPFAHHWSGRESQLAAARDRWDRVATLVANTDPLRRTLDAARRASGAEQDRVVAGATPALAASVLQELVQRDASQSAVQLERVDAAGEPHADKPGLLAIPVQLQARGDLYGLVDFLGRLEGGTPLLVVDEITVDAGLDPDGDGGPIVTAVAGAPHQTLTWTLRLHGLYEGSAAESR
jgi:general secretion pathway protein M